MDMMKAAPLEQRVDKSRLKEAVHLVESLVLLVSDDELVDLRYDGVLTEELCHHLLKCSRRRRFD